ncbi:MAG: DUF6128 domain-containing protein [Clostridium sp.]|jgi:hypothetical protein|nr:DUF6128 domain-containing protein [Clostridium sp.]
MFYDRKIKYLDYLENGDKIRNAGFVKIEALDGKCGLQVCVNGLLSTDTLQREVWIGDGERETVIGNIHLTAGKGTLALKGQPTDGLGKDRIPYQELHGIRIPLSRNRELRCQWGERQVTEGEEGRGVERKAGNTEEGRVGRAWEEAGEGTERQVGEERIRKEREWEAEREGWRGNLRGTGREEAGEGTERQIGEERIRKEREWEAEREGWRGNLRGTGKEVEKKAESAVEEEAQRGERAREEAEGGDRGEVRERTDQQAEEERIKGIREKLVKKIEKEWTRESGKEWIAEPMEKTVEVLIEESDEDSGETSPGNRTRHGNCTEKNANAAAEIGQTAERNNQQGVTHMARLFAEDKWKQLCSIYPHIAPFQDEREYLSVSPSDFVILHRNFHKLVNNSFLLHGYYNYEHLALARVAKKGEERFYIGVPGNFYEREKQVAVMFGFENFECKREPAREGDFGYYMARVEI